MRNIKICSVLSGAMILFAGSAFATTSSQILVMSNQLYQIAKDLTTGLFPTSILLIAIGMWGFVNAFGKSIGDGIHQLTNIFEDGNKVFIRMSDHVDHSQLPVFMAIDRGGQTEVVNYRYFKPYYVIDTVFDQGVLILGTDKYRQIVKIIRV